MKGVLIFLIICSCLFSLWAERPEHRPQTIAETFLRAMQTRDFATAGACVLPSQSGQFTLIATWSELSGWLAIASQASDFPVLRSYRTASTMELDYNLGPRGIARLEMRKLDQSWYLDLLATRFQIDPKSSAAKNAIQPANSSRSPQERAKLFLEALQKGDFDLAESLGTPRTRSILALIASLAPGVQSTGKPPAANQVLSENSQGEAARVGYRGPDGHPHSLDLIRVGTDWMVDLAQDQIDF